MMGRRPIPTISPTTATTETGLETTTSPETDSGKTDFFSKEVALIVVILVWLYFVFRLVIQAIVHVITIRHARQPENQPPATEPPASRQSEAHQPQGSLPVQSPSPELEWDGSFDALPLDLSSTAPRSNTNLLTPSSASPAANNPTTATRDPTVNSAASALNLTPARQTDNSAARLSARKPSAASSIATPSVSPANPATSGLRKAPKKTSTRLAEPKKSQTVNRPPWNGSVRTTSAATTKTQTKRDVEQPARAVRQRKQTSSLSINHSRKKY
ncbi:Oidioi.mRNA.OKI2018_I69.PAR.g10453.t1.cds [Oikopleura dioica]|uniref:Oidioi.mRNA.OKI2018_I69.PAR.g10453.t1.cds n=1 Tax=Oikopleura dioica TaxID=34765 RepID=A0ABN7RQT0_OIKDI|nr:Oidioi.mRNA.OKI2018_I69.PAR.g10453.t1.cds [Oikopleura dioica]